MDERKDEIAAAVDDFKVPAWPLTKTVATVGPVSEDEETIQKLVDEKMKIMRINFSHATYEEAKMRIDRLRAATGMHVHSQMTTPFRKFNVRAVLLDTQGPEIRTGKVKGNARSKIELKGGDRVTLSTRDADREACDASLIYVDYDELPALLSEGSQVLLDDGLIGLRVIATKEQTIECEIENSGLLGSTKGVNVPGTVVNLPPLSEKDKRDLEFGVENGVDFVAASFVRKASDVEAVRDFLRQAGERRWGEDFKSPLVISKIESEEGLQNLSSILSVSDGIMVARGDLGVEIPVEQVFHAQKDIIDQCRRVGKPVIVATQMLESMQSSPRPTRAEVSDVANAVLDGADCVMLSGETANGSYPVESCRMMKRAVLQADFFLGERRKTERREDAADRLSLGNVDRTHVDMNPVRKHYINEFETVARAAVDAARDFDAPLILVLTRTGLTAKLISAHRPDIPVMCVTNSKRVGRQLQLYRSLVPAVLPVLDGDEEEPRVEEAIDCAKQMRLLSSGDKVIVVSAQQGTRLVREAIAMKITTVK
eukprot:g432.t1